MTVVRGRPLSSTIQKFLAVAGICMTKIEKQTEARNMLASVAAEDPTP
jgi:hypothetical protein